MNQYVLSQSSSPTYFFQPMHTPSLSSLIYRPAELSQYQYLNPHANINRAIYSENQTKNPPSVISPRNAAPDGPKPFLSPQKQAKPPEKPKMPIESVEDVVAKCLSRTQKLIEGIKKVKKLEVPGNESQGFEAIHDEKSRSESKVHEIQISRVFSPLKQNFPLSSPQKRSQIPLNTSSPPKLVFNSVLITNSPMRRLSSPPRSIVINGSPSRIVTNFIFLNPIYVANEIESYKGDITENKPHGRGVCVYKNGYRYEGEFNLGLKHGFGILRNLKGEELYCGDWELGRFNGDGILLNPFFEETKDSVIEERDCEDLSNIQELWKKYEGSFQEGRMHGLGTLHLANGDKFRGKFVSGGINGEGSFYSRKGEIVMGTWEKVLYTVMSKGFNINFGASSIPTFEQEDELIAGEAISLSFELPNGKIIQNSFKMGQDVEWAKSVLAQKLGCQMRDMTFYFNNEVMIDILSFSDIQGLKNNSAIKVQLNPNVTLSLEDEEFKN